MSTTKKMTQVLSYLATNPVAIICFHASEMVLHIHSDVSYLSVSKAWSRASGVNFSSDSPPKQEDWIVCTSPLDVILRVVCKILSNIMTPAIVAELGALFVNVQELVPIRIILIEMGHP